MFFVKDFSDSPVNHRRPPVNHRRLAVNHRRLVTKKKKMTKSKKNNFFFIHFLDESEPSESKKSSAQKKNILRKLLRFSTFFLRPKPSTRLNMAYMRFHQKMLGGSDFFWDLDSPIFWNFIWFFTINTEKNPKLFRRARAEQRGGETPPLRTSPPLREAKLLCIYTGASGPLRDFSPCHFLPKIPKLKTLELSQERP